MNVFRIILVLIYLIPFDIHGQSAFRFENELVSPGTKAHFNIPVSDGLDSTFIPITIFHGKEKGQVLGITAGVHGYEYPPIIAGQQLINEIDPINLKGTIILVQAANVSSFLQRTPFENPLDNKNLNRSFPGNKNGSITERIAHFISTKVIAQSDIFLDMHGGDAPEDLMPYAAYYHHDQMEEVSKQGKEMTIALGFDHIIVFNTTNKEYVKEDKPSLYCSAEAFKREIPSMDIECGRLGKVEPQAVQKIVDGVLNLLVHIDMIKGTELSVKAPIFIENRHYISSKQDGIFYPLKSSGDYVSKGMKVGYITNFFGETETEVYASNNGILLYLIGTPPVNKGETLVVIGEVN